MKTEEEMIDLIRSVIDMGVEDEIRPDGEPFLIHRNADSYTFLWNRPQPCLKGFAFRTVTDLIQFLKGKGVIGTPIVEEAEKIAVL
jgi:hypothetical protein